MGWDWAARAGPSGQGQVLGGGGDGATEGAHPAPCSPRRGFTTAPPPCPGSNFGQACPVCQQLPSALRHESHWWQRERIHSSRAEPGRACVLGLSARRVVSGLPGARPSGHGMFLSPDSSPSAQTSQPPSPRAVLCVHVCECVCMRVSVHECPCACACVPVCPRSCTHGSHTLPRGPCSPQRAFPSTDRRQTALISVNDNSHQSPSAAVEWKRSRGRVTGPLRWYLWPVCVLRRHQALAPRPVADIRAGIWGRRPPGAGARVGSSSWPGPTATATWAAPREEQRLPGRADGGGAAGCGQPGSGRAAGGRGAGEALAGRKTPPASQAEPSSLFLSLTVCVSGVGVTALRPCPCPRRARPGLAHSGWDCI